MYIISCHWEIDQNIHGWPYLKNTPTIPPLVRRRLTTLGQMAFRGFYSTKERANGQDLPWVVSSRHGDYQRTQNLLTELSTQEPISPTNFSLSVHNAIAGQFAIATGNKQPQTVLAAGPKSFELGLLEAFCLQQELGQPVGYIYYDQALPQPYEPELSTDKICIAMILTDIAPRNKEPAIQITYTATTTPATDSNVDGILELTHFIDSDAPTFNIPLPFGSFFMERIHG
ncbi:beta-ketoacyl synthase chain length factor [Candidatus Odyssella acanthamoebae]|uniref:beta-ketoacyl synthase chain length factor n=1 Tax=Candidatus Odyssella acanthamoebae TaxID=91604 RepID=UPI00068CCE31|nr:beta-ketoacyl synthase chain length factor [Candidatus Paracaedibacter acanthamoebae]